MKQLRKSNEGFSLVETLIAMTVLVICAIPLLKAFILAGKNNLSGRQLLNATAIAENFIEEIKSNGVETYADGTNGMAWNTVNSVEINGKYYPIYEHSNSAFTFDGKTYQVDITMTPSTQQVGDVAYLYDVNGQMTPQLNTMDAMTDAVYVQAVDDTDKVVESYANAHIGVHANALQNNIKVTYNFAVDYKYLSGTTGDKYYMINQQIVYSKASDNTPIAQKMETIYCSKEPPKNLYICYVPESDADIINVELNNGVDFQVPLNVYVVRQDTSSTKKIEVNLYNNFGSTKDFALRSNVSLSASDMILKKNAIELGTLPMAQQQVDFSTLSKEVDGGVAIYEIQVVVKSNNGDILTSLTGTAMR